MRWKRLLLTLTIVLGLSLTVFGCEYDPSLYDGGNDIDDGTGSRITGILLEDTAIVNEPREDAEEIELLSAGDVIIITGDEEDGYYPVEYNDSISGYVPVYCVDFQEINVEDELVDENVITAITIDDVNIRRGPGQNYELIENVGPGTVLTIIGEQENGYYPVDYNGEIGYAHHNFIEINESPVSAVSGMDTVLTATVIDDVNIRRGPGQNYELIDSVGPGAVLTIIGEEENGYYPVDYNGEVGYAHHNFIEINDALVTTTETTVSITEETSVSSSASSGMDSGTLAAYYDAQDYLRFTSFSRAGLIEQLSSPYGEGYPIEQATAAVNALEANGLVDWNAEAIRSAQSYLDFTAFSRQGLIDQLSSSYGEGFTVEQATYGVSFLENNGFVDWNEQAVLCAQDYLALFDYSRQELIDQLSSSYGEQFTMAQATYAANQVGLN